MAGQLPDSPARVIAKLLVDLGLGSDPAGSGAWPVRVGSSPDSPDNLLTVTDVAGREDGRRNTDGFKFEHHGVQVRVRSNDPAAGAKKAREVAVAMDEAVLNALVVVPLDGGNGGPNTYSVPSVGRTSGVLSLGKEVTSSKRSLFTLNLLAPIILNGAGPVDVDESDGFLLWD